MAIPASILLEMHKPHSDGSVIALAEIPEKSLYYARNTQDVVWNGITWEKSWFEFETIEELASSKVPELQVALSNLDGQAERTIIQYDNFEECSLILRFVNTNCLTETTPLAQVTFQIMKPICNNYTASLKLAIDNPLLQIFPSRIYHSSICQYKQFKDALCGYTGAYTTCGRTILDCIDRGNEKRFGAQLGLSDDYAELDEDYA